MLPDEFQMLTIPSCHLKCKATEMSWVSTWCSFLLNFSLDFKQAQRYISLNEFIDLGEAVMEANEL
jgi:hypothetical protein